ncbi:Coenzyme F420 hydrogenase/dehydrogenase, beta subunit C-terminal domain [Oricola sp.]|uniref:Coenzyme F420 hydrogenase/dehydrogenase, beta subunit C-terminal domain n=1 Tax=Oricola sp. TaxID=1979950 RepID=UPI0025D95C25|nr:Coenzyme F420 hydrogenase/dehydrogenase, beta subunit C-terminal domain [Oricola sp.]MCI5074476.1 Coenzyme F420 hydrogenase/dehydrogenase, beta subunit C-terminal domain [Oricola sp.]
MRVAERVEDIVTSGLCTGCGMCESLLGSDTLRMDLSPEGFMRPRQIRTLSKADEGAVMQACAGHRQVGPEPVGIEPHRMFGSCLHLAKGHATAPDMRFEGATGGVLTAVAAFLVEEKLVDAIIQIGASDSDPFANEVRFNTTREEIVASAGSRYGPVAPLTQVHAALDSGKRFAFIGKPCDVATLRNLAKTDPRVDRQIPYMLAMFCGGSPSVSATHNVVRRFGEDPREIAEFRYRGRGWPGPTFVRTRKGTVHRQSYDDTWFGDLTFELMFRCKICADGLGEHADLVGGDCWVMEDGKPSHREMGDGWNIVIGRTTRGAELAAKAVEAGYLHEEPFTIAEFEKMHDDHALKKRSVFWRLLALTATRQPRPRYERLRVAEAGWRNASWRERWAAFQGTFLRSVAGRNRESGIGSGSFVLEETRNDIEKPARGGEPHAA